MKQYNTRATLAPTLNTMKSNQDTASLVGAIKSLLGGVGTGINTRRQGQQTASFVNNLRDQVISLTEQISSTTDPMMKRALEMEKGRLIMLGGQASFNPTGIDKYVSDYSGLYSKIGDPLSLANALQIAQIGADARIAAANALAGSNPTIKIGGETIGAGGTPATPGTPLTMQNILKKMGLTGSGMSFQNAPSMYGLFNGIMDLTGVGG